MDEFPNQLVSMFSNITVLVTKTMLVLTTGLVPSQRPGTRVQGKSPVFITVEGYSGRQWQMELFPWCFPQPFSTPFTLSEQCL